MDSFEWNKIAGAVLGTLLFVVAVRIASGFIFEVKEPAKPGYVVQGVEAPASGGATQAAAEEPLPDWGTVLPKANVADGKSISTRCEPRSLQRGPEQDRPESVGRRGPPARFASRFRVFQCHEIQGRGLDL
jgi:cytochrome c